MTAVPDLQLSLPIKGNWKRSAAPRNMFASHFNAWHLSVIYEHFPDSPECAHFELCAIIVLWCTGLFVELRKAGVFMSSLSNLAGCFDDSIHYHHSLLVFIQLEMRDVAWSFFWKLGDAWEKLQTWQKEDATFNSIWLSIKATLQNGRSRGEGLRSG